MIGLLIIGVALLHSYRSKSTLYFGLYNVLVLISLVIYMIYDIEAAFQIDNRPSDSELYYSGFMSDFNEISTFLFYQYPLFLKIICYPLNNSIYATFIQSNLIFLLLDVIIKQKKYLLLFITLHSLLYTSTNLFKDNFLIIIGLFTVYLLINIKNVVIQSLIIFLSFTVMGWVRPFFLMIIPFSLIPFYVRAKSRKIKTTFIVFGLLTCVGIIVSNLSLINYVISSWASEASVQDTKSSFPIAMIKIILGPAPRHYLFHQQYFEQPFLDIQGVFYAFIHICYYFTVSLFFIYVFKYYKTIFDFYKISIDKLYAFVVFFFLIIVYGFAYGSADIRQRALIMLFLYIFALYDDKKVFVRYFNIRNTVLYIFIILILSIMTLIF